MKAAVLNQIPGELEIEDISIDKPGPNEVLVQVVNAGLCTAISTLWMPPGKPSYRPSWAMKVRELFKQWVTTLRT